MMLALPALAADREVSESGPASPDGLVLIENVSGSVTVTGWDRDEVSLTGTLSGDVEELQFETGKKKSRIKVVWPKKKKNVDGEALLEIKVPHGSEVEVECVSAWVEVSGVTGSVEAASISGEVTVTGACEEIEAESISGDVVVDGGAPEIEAASISGDVQVRGSVCEVDAQSVSGNLSLACERFLGLNVESVSGYAKVEGDLDSEGSFSFDLHSGDLILMVPADVSADFEIETFSGEIDNGFGQKSRKTSKYAPGRELEFPTGAGEARVRISTFSGDVVIRKK